MSIGFTCTDHMMNLFNLIQDSRGPSDGSTACEAGRATGDSHLPYSFHQMVRLSEDERLFLSANTIALELIKLSITVVPPNIADLGTDEKWAVLIDRF